MEVIFKGLLSERRTRRPYVRYLLRIYVDGQEKENLKALDLPIHLFIFLELLMPPAARGSFEKPPLDPTKLLLESLRAIFLLRVSSCLHVSSRLTSKFLICYLIKRVQNPLFERLIRLEPD